MPARLPLLAALCVAPLLAERLPIRTYTTADGLPTGGANCIVADSRGFLWICTFDGLVRFDGYTFVTYGLKDGIPDRSVTAFLETRDGAYWIGTYRGIHRFQPDAMGSNRPVFVRYSMPGPEASQHITALAQDRDGDLWCGTRDGLYRQRPGGGFQAVEIGLPARSWKTRFIGALAVDRQNAIWVGTEDAGLYRRRPDGRVDRYPAASVSSLVSDRQGRIWAGSSSGISLLTPSSNSDRFDLSRFFGLRQGLPNQRVKALLETADGDIWAGTEDGVGVLAPDSHRFRSLGAANGLPDIQIRALGVDSENNVWIASTSYLMRVARAGFLTYDTSDGLGGHQVTSIFEDPAGRLYVVNGVRRILVNRFDGERFTSVRPMLKRGAKSIRYMGWGTGQTVLRDRSADWWIPTGEGLCRFTNIQRFEELARTPPYAVYNRDDGLPGDDIFRVFEDSHGGLWVGTVDTPGLARWQPQTGRFRTVSEREGYGTPNPPAAFAEDRTGGLWVGLFWNGLARFRDGRWQMFRAADGVPDGSLWAMICDRRGRIWIGSSSSGLVRVDDTAAGKPRFVHYTTRQGLSSDLVWSLAEDRRGCIYIGNRRGIDVLDPETGHVRYFSNSDGLAGGDLAAALCDRMGRLWFGATTGLSRLLPEPAHKAAPPPVRITALRTAGVARPLSALGEMDLSGLELGPDQNHLEIEFASFNFRVGSPIRYQYRLAGVSPEWSGPAETRSVNLVGLAPGSYRFEVRALRDGLASSAPARIAFRVMPPLWRRWWAILTASLCGVAILYAVYRYRVGQLVALERVRTRIAMDLHDDIGSSLSQITVLSEVARQQAGSEDARLKEPLLRVIEISRELAGSLGDIVWAINPQRDRIGDLVQRMRRFGGDVLHSRNIDFDCLAPETLLAIEIGADLRRQVLLVFKESIHNIARHSGCRRAKAELALRDRQICLTISDDGVGFDLEDGAGQGGNGLASIKKRAQQIGGSVQVQSVRGRGTTVLMTIPLRRRYLFRW